VDVRERRHDGDDEQPDVASREPQEREEEDEEAEREVRDEGAPRDDLAYAITPRGENAFAKSSSSSARVLATHFRTTNGGLTRTYGSLPTPT
jgi:hypothetical protein